MPPAQFFTGPGPSPIGTPPVSNAGAAATTTGTLEPQTGILRDRMARILRHDQDKTQLLEELFIRYNYISTEYERLNKEHREATLKWQLEKQACAETLRSMEITIDRNPFVVALVDGDGMIFQYDYLKDGELGGRRAAAKLHSAISHYIAHEVNDIPVESRIICRVYANVEGLSEVLARAGAIENAGLFEDFVRGFTRGKIMFDFVDVGPGKDRADEKIIETFKIFINDIHCRQVFLGCSHDNGYARLLEDNVADPVYTSKVVLMEGVPFEKELVALPHRKKKFEGLFRDSKISFPSEASPVAGGSPVSSTPKNYNMIGGLPSRFPPPSRVGTPQDKDLLLDSPIPPKATLNMPRTPSTSTLASSDGIAPKMNWAAKAAAPPPSRTETPVYKPANREEVVARNRLGQRVDPPSKDYDKAEVDRIKKIKMCNVHFLRQECPFGNNCTHLHAYQPTDNELNTLRLVARMAPCQNGSSCADIKCIYGHRCPAPAAKTPTKSGKTCIFGDQCKFPPELHDVDCNVVKTLVVR
ncbi:hypothetical protein BS50DRAFT_554718 [Corynespora cassiicola Philippines]|uniref:C3H1-type domain-containing protein n=1 Tax=Corynespora cassiicola Philippines TaxID=1448308 RepID=A0A2T2NLW1_CORCC|nr:hypothetical protein BS50DRAFT_554718 [Corynespora cassiicola Philippines]